MTGEPRARLPRCSARRLLFLLIGTRYSRDFAQAGPAPSLLFGSAQALPATLAAEGDAKSLDPILDPNSPKPAGIGRDCPAWRRVVQPTNADGSRHRGK